MFMLGLKSSWGNIGIYEYRDIGNMGNIGNIGNIWNIGNIGNIGI